METKQKKSEETEELKGIFVQAINNMEEQFRRDRERTEHLQEVFGGFIENYDYEPVLKSLFKLLSYVVDDESELIGYYVYELEFGKHSHRLSAYDSDGTKIPLDNVGELWDYFVKNNKVKI